MTYLAATALSNLWDTDADRVVLLGPWCLVGLDSFRGNKATCSLMTSPWENKTDLVRAGRECETLCDRVFDRLAPFLSEAVGITYDERQWRILGRSWLLHTIGQLRDRYACVSKAVDDYRKPTATCLDPASYRVMLGDGDCMSRCNDEDYNLQLFSVVCRELGVPHSLVGREDVRAGTAETYSPSARRGGKAASVARLVQKSTRALPWLVAQHIHPGSEVLIVAPYHLNGIDLTSLAIKCGVTTRILAAEGPDLSKVAIDWGRRAQIKALAGPDEFERILFQALLHMVPVSVLEGFHLVERASASTFGRQTRHVVSAIGWYSDDRVIHYAAKAAADNRRLVGLQHGGGYGHYEYTPLERIEIGEGDLFYTWGWRHERWPEKTIPLPSPHLSRLRDRHREVTRDVVYVGTTFPRYFYRMQSGPTPDDFLKYLEDMVLFVDDLQPNLRGRVLFRLHPLDYGWKIRERLLRDHPSARVTTQSAVDLMTKARVAVIDHPSTGFLEALALDVPTVLFWDHTAWPMRTEAEASFQRLRDVGILHRSPTSAARQVAAQFESASCWWESSEVQSARLDVLNRYGWTSPNWRDEWAEALSRLDELSLRQG